MRTLAVFFLGISAATAWAQPDTSHKTAAPQTPAPRTARPVELTAAQQVDKVARDFVEDINENLMLAAQEKIDGARRGFFGANVWLPEFAASFPFQITIQSVSAPQINADTASTTVTYRLEAKKDAAGKTDVTDEMKPFLAQEQSETLQLKLDSRVYDLSHKTWQIVPPDLEPTERPSKGLTPSLLAYFAFKVAQRPVTEKNADSLRSLTNLKGLVAALAVFTQDYDEQFAFAPEYMREALTPYLKNKALFNVPGGYELYAFNANLAERFVSNLGVKGIVAPNDPRYIKDQARTVLFYEGHDQQPTFRYAGKAAIAFADGRVALVTPEEAKDLIWKPR